MTDTTRTQAAPLTVVPREQHAISRKDISPSALRVLYRLHEAGYGAFLVGGAVRDLLLGEHPKDFDVATDATPEQVKHLFRNCRLIGRRFRLAHVVYGKEIIEVATFRANSDDGSGDRETDEDGRVLRDNVYGTVEDDAVRRDFTANALYYAISDFSVRDYTGGFEDVNNRVLKLIGDPETRYREDPVRMLRAVRLSAKLRFTIDPASADPIPKMASLLQEASPARLFEECLKLFLSGHAEASFLGLEANGLLSALFPETAAAIASNRNGALRRMVLEGLRATDARIASDVPVSPAFLFALLLWPAYCRSLAILQAQGVHAADAERRAADRVTLHQVNTVALPRRFSLPMQEIWLLQARFPLRQRKRVVRLMAHPRFRAAFDFLMLRQAATGSHDADVAFWSEAQRDPDHALVIAAARARDDADDTGRDDPTQDDAGALSGDASDGTSRKPRRRRRRRPVSAPH